MNPSPAAGTFLPDFCGSRLIFVVVLLAELLAICLTLVQMDAGTGFPTLALLSIYTQAVAIGCAAALCLLQSRIRDLPDPWAAALGYGTTLVVTIIVADIAWRASGAWLAAPGTRQAPYGVFMLHSLGVSAIAWALALRYFYVQHELRKRIVSESDARFQALQARIRPHFLFNCMNTIASLTRSTPQLAEQVVEDLAELFRASLREADQPQTLADELALCERYLRIEQQRLGDRLGIDLTAADCDGDLRLPALSLQPLVENAVYHGIEPLPGGGTIRIRCERTADGVTVTIANPLPRRTGMASHDGNRVAQENVAQRLNTFFGRPGLLRITESPDEYRVTVTIPARA